MRRPWKLPQSSILIQTACLLVCSVVIGLFHSATATAQSVASTLRPLLVVGFMGGRVKADNMVHKEAVVARDLQQRNPGGLKVLIFANHDGSLPLQAVLRFLDGNHDGHLSEEEKSTARIVIYGHSWGASETIHLARLLNDQQVPVLLTIQVDSVQKFGENDEVVPPNVREALNFYQKEGMLRGRPLIRAEDPRKTVILGNKEISYKKSPVACDQFPWFARTFMRQHIEIENDPKVWNQIEAMIQSEVH